MKENINWDDLSPIDKELLEAFRDSTPEAQEIGLRIFRLFNTGKDQEAFALLADTLAKYLRN